MSFFIEANYDGTKQNRTSFKGYHTVKDVGENIFRIAPPCRSLVALPNPDYAIYNSVHFGYSVPDPLNPDRMFKKPFYCIHKVNYKTKKVEVQCPECAKIAEVKAEMDKLKAELTKEGHPEAYIKQALSPQFAWLGEHNLDRKWYGYAKNLAGEWNIFKLGHKAKLALDDRMKRTFKEDQIKGLDPASGVWFKFTKNGLKGPNALTTVEVLKEKVDMNGQKVEVVKTAPLTEADVKAIEGLGDVANVCARLTFDQINALVNSGGNPEVAKQVFALGTKVEKTETPVTGTSGTTTTPVTNTVGTTGVTATVPPKTLAPAPPKPTSQEIADMDADKFLRMFAKS